MAGLKPDQLGDFVGKVDQRRRLNLRRLHTRVGRLHDLASAVGQIRVGGKLIDETIIKSKFLKRFKWLCRFGHGVWQLQKLRLGKNEQAMM